MSTTLEALTWQRGIKLDFIRPGKSNKDAHMLFNRQLRDRCLNAIQFGYMRNARGESEAWRQD